MAGSESGLIELWPEGAPLAAGETDEDRPAITPYLVESEGQGAVIVVPGGGYGTRAFHEGEPIALWLNSLGVSAFVLRYRVAPYRYPSALLDVQRAIRHVRLHAGEFGIDPGKVGVLGFSAGGHLSAMAGAHYDSGSEAAEDPVERMSSRPDLMVLCYPVIAMTGPYAHAGSRKNLLGDEPDEELVRKMSGDLQVTPDTPPAFLWHTSDDAGVAVENCLLYAAALSRARVPFDLHVYEKGRHGLGLATEDEHVASWTHVCGLWLKRYQFY